MVIQEDNTNIKDSNNFRNKNKNNDIPVDSLLVTVVGRDWYPSIRHEVSLKGLKRALEKRKEENMSYDNLAKIKEFFFEALLV